MTKKTVSVLYRHFGKIRQGEAHLLRLENGNILWRNGNNALVIGDTPYGRGDTNPGTEGRGGRGDGGADHDRPGHTDEDTGRWPGCFD